MTRNIRVTILPDGSEVFEGDPAEVLRALEKRRQTRSATPVVAVDAPEAKIQTAPPTGKDAASRLIELATNSDTFHMSQAIWTYVGHFVPTRIDGEPNPEYHQAYRAVQNVLSTYAATNNYEFAVRRDGRHNVLQLRQKELG